MTIAHFTTDAGRRIAYHRTPGRGPGIVFLGGFRSDMTGTKAQFVETWARGQGRACLRFDYSGHGASSGEFRDGCIGDWAQDAEAALAHLTQGPQILIGSSMGGWIALLLARRAPALVAGIVGIAAAPDFTEDAIWAAFDAESRASLLDDGEVEQPSDYSDAPYIITRRLIQDGRRHLVLRDPLHLPMPVRLLHGCEDRDVAQSVPLALLAHATGPDLRLTFVKHADHRFSGAAECALIAETLAAIVPQAPCG